MAAPLYWLCGFGFEADSGFGQHTEKVPGRHEKSPMPSASNRPCRAFIARIIKGNSMRFGLNFTVKAIIISGLLMHGAAAQTSSQASGQPAGQQPASATDTAVHGSGENMAQSAAIPPEWLNAGTLAESAESTALSTSTYHQPTGFLPGMKP